MSQTAGAPPFVPVHLRQYVREQDESQYSAVDQAVWRFVLLQLQAKLADGAHPSYGAGLAATGISVDRIPSIAEMNDKLGRFGWGAVCVDGFVPPRVFQEFQAAGILPIAGDIRSRQHLPYTPAPDIIHEAAGHAPILPDAVFAGYLRRLGALGAEAFTLPEESAVFEAIHLLSEIKERPGVPASEVNGAEMHLQIALAAVPAVSEAALLSRLYWWTAEYGLVGTPDDFKLYGAGLLSSLGESHSCRAASVLKLPLDATCLDVPYDITRRQPQLFVARSFEDLHRVLDDVERRLRRDRPTALARALRSRDVATVTFSSGGAAIGVLAKVGAADGAVTDADGPGPGAGAPAWLAFEGPFAFTYPGGTRMPATPARTASRTLVLTGPLADGAWLDGLTADDALDGYRVARAARHRFAFASGAWIEGRVVRRLPRGDGRLGGIDLADVQIGLPGRRLDVPTGKGADAAADLNLACAHHRLWAAGEVVTARAGAADPAFHGVLASAVNQQKRLRIPRPRPLPPGERDLLSLYQQAEAAAGGVRGEELVDFFAAIHRAVRRDHPEEWLLRWNLLESLKKAREPGAASGRGQAALEHDLVSDLETLERAFAHEQPIATGLDSLRGPPRLRA